MSLRTNANCLCKRPNISVNLCLALVGKVADTIQPISDAADLGYEIGSDIEPFQP